MDKYRWAFFVVTVIGLISVFAYAFKDSEANRNAACMVELKYAQEKSQKWEDKYIELSERYQTVQAAKQGVQAIADSLQKKP